MRIDLFAGVPQASELKPSKADSGVSATRAYPERDTAQLSSRSSEVENLAAQATSLPEIREDRVAALARRVKAGTYSVPAQQMAESLLTYMQK
jgi:flagellar biosynthesis anti-sigma factor FlgM